MTVGIEGINLGAETTSSSTERDGLVSRNSSSLVERAQVNAALLGVDTDSQRNRFYEELDAEKPDNRYGLRAA